MDEKEKDVTVELTDAEKTEAKALAESLIAKDNEKRAEAEAREKRVVDEAGRIVSEQKAQRIREANTRKIESVDSGSITLAKELGCNLETPEFRGAFALKGGLGGRVVKSYGRDAGRDFTTEEKADMWVAGSLLQALMRKRFEEANRISDACAKTLYAGVGAVGGFLIPVGFIAQLIENIDATGPYRQLVNVIPVTTPTGSIPAESTNTTVSYIAENAAKPASKPTFRQVAWNVHEKVALVIFSELLSISTPINLAQYLSNKIARDFSVYEWNIFINGTGVGQPTGLATAVINNTYACGAAFTFDDVNLGFHSLPYQYRTNASWIMRDDRVATISNLQDTNGLPIYTNGLLTQNGLGMLKGKSIYPNDTITEDTAAPPGATIYFGDWYYYKHFQLQDFRVDISNQATVVDESGNTINLWQQNQAAIKAWTYDDATLGNPNAVTTITNVP